MRGSSNGNEKFPMHTTSCLSTTRERVCAYVFMYAWHCVNKYHNCEQCSFVCACQLQMKEQRNKWKPLCHLLPSMLRNSSNPMTHGGAKFPDIWGSYLHQCARIVRFCVQGVNRIEFMKSDRRGCSQFDFCFFRSSATLHKDYDFLNSRFLWLFSRCVFFRFV